MKKSIYLSLALLFVTVAATAQSTVIRGTLRDTNNDPVSYCNVIQMSDSTAKATLITGTTSDLNGAFSIKAKGTNVYLRFNSLGYSDLWKVINTKKAERHNDTINIGVVTLQTNGVNLNEVNIIGNQTRIEMNEDKIVMNVDEEVQATSANAFEMLRKVPGVVIDKDENISLNGQSGILFQFDGRDIKIPYESIKAMLKSMSPSNVEKIETINNPSSKYEAEGTAGIINIVMTKEQTKGFSGNANSWFGVNRDLKMNHGVTLNWVSDRWTISTGGGYSLFNNSITQQYSQYMWGQGIDTVRFLTAENIHPSKFKSLNFNFSADYRIDKNSSIGLSLTADGNAMHYLDPPSTFTSISQYPYTTIDSSYSENGALWNKSHDYIASLYYNKKLDTIGGQFSLSFDFSHDKSHKENSSTTSYYTGYLENLLREDCLDNNTDNGNNSYALKFDVIKPFNDKMRLEYGLKTRLAVVGNDFAAFVNGENDENRTNSLGYKENVNAAYVSFSDQLTEKFSFRSGLRFEHTFTSIEQKTSNEKIDNNYFDIFPNLNLSYRIGKTDNLALTYSYRITRPDYNSMNPFIVKSTDYNFTSGNPYLDPQYTHKIDLNYAFHYMVFLTASYSFTNHEINEVIISDPTTLTITQKPYNLGRSENASLGIYTMLPLGPVEWTIWMQGAYQHSQCNDELLTTDIKRLSFMTWQSLTIDFFLKTKLSASVFYTTGGVDMTYEYDDMLMLNASLTREFLQKQLKVSLGVNNFPKRDMHVDVNSNNLHMAIVQCWQRPMFTVNATYSFGKTSDSNKLKRIESDDMNDRTSGSSNMGQQQQQMGNQ